MSTSTAMPQIIDVVFETLRAHVDNLSPEQQLDFSAKILSFSQSPVSSPASSTSVSEPASSPAASTTTIRPRRRPASRRAQGNRVKKMVNAFMTFRAYIAPILGKIPQKSRSPMLSLMWRAEQRKGQFNLLGAAFSKIRDECSDCPPLEKFLEVASLAVTVIPADQYLELTGWTIVRNGLDFSLASVPTNDQQVIAAYPLHTNLSTQEIIQFCFDQGLINSVPQATTVQVSQPRPTISFAALPQNHDLQADDAEVSANVSANVSMPEDPFAFFDFNDLGSITGYGPSINVVTQDQQQAFDSIPAVAHWLPSIQPPVLGFDPTIIQDEFDAFSFELGGLPNL